MSKYRIVVTDNGISRIKDDPLRFHARIEKYVLFGWTRILGIYSGWDGDTARAEAELALKEYKNPPPPANPKVYYYD